MASRRSARLAILAGIVPTVVLGVSACDGEPAADDAAADSAAVATAAPVDAGIKACDLVSDAQLESILGLDLEPGRTTNDYAGDSKCEWDLPGDAQRGVTISLRVLDDLAIYRAVPGGIDAPDIGNEAIWNPTYGQLAVRQGGRVVSIALLIDAPRREHAEEIARLTLARL